MENSDQPVRCGCGGEAEVHVIGDETGTLGVYVVCEKCLTQTEVKRTKAEAITVWNRAMGKKTGEWISVDSDTVDGICSVCGYESHLYENDVYGEHYCPNCGAWLRLT